jgi:hypothetical protein
VTAGLAVTLGTGVKAGVGPGTDWTAGSVPALAELPDGPPETCGFVPQAWAK